jgi:hypothetical protein
VVVSKSAVPEIGGGRAADPWATELADRLTEEEIHSKLPMHGAPLKVSQPANCVLKSLVVTWWVGVDNLWCPLSPWFPMPIVKPELELRGFSASCELVASPSSVVTKVQVVDTSVVMVFVIVRVMEDGQAPVKSLPYTLGEG